VFQRATLCAFGLCFGLLRPAFADSPIDGRPIQNGIGIEVGAIMNGGMSEFADDQANITPAANGLFIRDRNGMTSRMVIGAVIAVAGALAQSGPKGGESKSYRPGDYIITETTTTYYSEEEKAQMRANTSKAIDGLFSAPYSDFELQLYSRDRFGHTDTSGYKANFFIGSGTKKLAYETGFGFGKADSLVDDETFGMTHVKWRYFGMPFRVNAVVGPVRFSATYEWNWSKYGLKGSEERLLRPEMDAMGAPTGRKVVTSVSHPWHAELSMTLFKRVALSGGVTLQTIKKPELGYFATAGLFF